MIGFGKTSKNDTITAAVIGLAQSLDIDVVVEGVETAQQLAFFQGRGTLAIQGWHFSKALPATNATAWLRGRAAFRSPATLLATG